MAASIRDRIIAFIHGLATGSRQRRNLFTPVGALIFAAFVALAVYLARLADALLGLAHLPPRPFDLLAGGPLLIFGAWLSGWAVLNFLKAKGTPVPANPPPRLVVTGPYALCRNPMLGGIFLMMFGLGLALGSVCLALVVTPLFALFNYWELKAIEEPELIKRLGRDYLAYRDKTPMFLPRPWAKK